MDAYWHLVFIFLADFLWRQLVSAAGGLSEKPESILFTQGQQNKERKRSMIDLSEEFVHEQIEYTLKHKLKKNEQFNQLSQKLLDYTEDKIELPPEESDALWKKYYRIYTEETYRLGFSEGMKVGAESEIDRDKTILSLKDMICLIKIHNAILQLNTLLHGEYISCGKEEGILGTLGCIGGVIEHGIPEENKLMERDKCAQWILSILDDETITAEEKAAQLLGGKQSQQKKSVADN